MCAVGGVEAAVRASGDVTVATQVSRDLWPPRRREVIRFAASAVRVDAQCIGWLPYDFYDEEDAAGRLMSVTRNGDLVGFVAWGINHLIAEALIVQIWIRKDARQIEHGRALVQRLESLVVRDGARRIRLWCADDLDANRFWPLVGFDKLAVRCGRGLHQIKRNHNLWLRQIVTGANEHARYTPAIVGSTAVEQGPQHQNGVGAARCDQQRCLIA